MKVFGRFRRRRGYGGEASTNCGLLTATEPRSIEQVVDELNAELEKFSPADLQWWEISQKIKTLKQWTRDPAAE
jgi:hypothetical protein